MNIEKKVDIFGNKLVDDVGYSLHLAKGWHQIGFSDNACSDFSFLENILEEYPQNVTIDFVHWLMQRHSRDFSKLNFDSWEISFCINSYFYLGRKSKSDLFYKESFLDYLAR